MSDASDNGEGISRETVIAVARLARLQLDERQAEALVPELQAILGLVARLGAVDVAGIAPMTTPAAGALPLREDGVLRDADREAVLAGAPESVGGLFRVPRVVD